MHNKCDEFDKSLNFSHMSTKPALQGIIYKFTGVTHFQSARTVSFFCALRSASLDDSVGRSITTWLTLFVLHRSGLPEQLKSLAASSGMFLNQLWRSGHVSSEGWWSRRYRNAAGSVFHTARPYIPSVQPTVAVRQFCTVSGGKGTMQNLNERLASYLDKVRLGNLIEKTNMYCLSR